MFKNPIRLKHIAYVYKFYVSTRFSHYSCFLISKYVLKNTYYKYVLVLLEMIKI